MTSLQEKRSSPPLGVMELHTWINVYAPKDQRWSASLREYDLGVEVFTGRTQRAAIDELLDSIEQDDGSLRE